MTQPADTPMPRREQLASAVIAAARARDITVAVAESLTGGLLASTLIGIPGASRVVTGGVVAYATHLKAAVLGVDASLLRESGPVHPDVATQMAAGVREVCTVETASPGGVSGSSMGIATTGVAGPDPDPATGQPAGTVWLGFSSESEVSSFELKLEGSRSEIRCETVIQALTLLLQKIEST